MKTSKWIADDMVIYKITEEEFAYASIDNFMPGLDRGLLDRNLDWFSKDGFEVATGRILLSYHSFIIQTPDHRILVDSCIGNHKTMPLRDAWHHKKDRRWLAEFEATGLKVEDIDYVLCSHMHFDHVGWNTQLRNGKWTPTFPNARYLFVDREYEFTRDWAKLHEEGAPLAAVFKHTFKESIEPVVQAGQADFVSAKHVLNPYVRFLPTPGHSPGHIAIAAGRGADLAVFTGDLIHSPLQALYPEIRMFSDENPDQGVETRRRFLAQYADSETLVCTMHFPDPSVGLLRRWRDGYRLQYLAPCKCAGHSSRQG